jgi:hypothetical protein
MKTRNLVLAVIATTLGLLASRGLTADEPELRDVMKAKLQHTHSVLEGLALEDFDRIKKGAEYLSRLSKAAAWNIHKTPLYVKFSKDFQDTADAMVKHAAEKKLEAVMLDYVQLTMLCVKCHTHTRKEGVAILDGAELPRLPRMALSPAK